MKKEIILVGGGGHCRSVIDVIESEGSFSIAGIIDVEEKLGQKILGYEIRWTDEQIEQLAAKYKHFLVTVGQINNPDARISLHEKIKTFGGLSPIIISPNAHVSPHAKIGEGTIVMHQAMVNAGCTVGNNTILNSGCLLEHDVEVGDHCHISTKAVVNGGTKISDQVFVGSSAVLSQMISIGKNSVISSGTVLRKSVPVDTLAFGNPAKTKLRSNER